MISDLFLPAYMFTVCVGGRLDVVFLVPASTDRVNLARPLRELLTSAAGSLNTIGPRDSQVNAREEYISNTDWVMFGKNGTKNTKEQAHDRTKGNCY